MGFTQKEGIDFFQTFAGVMLAKTFRTLLVIWNSDPTYEMEHWDVRMAFTNAPVEEELYMYQPEGWEKEEKTKYACKLLKSLYGLKQSARNWGILLRDIICDSSFTAFYSDPCMFFRVEQKKKCRKNFS